MSDDRQDQAEQLDSQNLVSDPNPDGLPGVNTISDRGPMHSEDPSLLLGGSETQDEIHTREWREQPEQTEITGEVAPSVVGLVDPADASDGLRDIEKTAVADAVDTDHDGTITPAEVDAIRIEER